MIGLERNFQKYIQWTLSYNNNARVMIKYLWTKSMRSINKTDFCATLSINEVQYILGFLILTELSPKMCW